jgi:hypothetical protein
MTERRLVVGDDSLLAILEGGKTRTSRVLPKTQVWKYEIGDTLWMSYTWATHKLSDNQSGLEAHEYWKIVPPLWIKALHVHDDAPERGRWRSSRFMPRVFSQILAKVESARIMHIQDISDHEIMDEGVNYFIHKYGDGDVRQAMLNMFTWMDDRRHWSHRTAARLKEEDAEMNKRTFFSVLWDSLNSKRGYSWSGNPLVWHVHFGSIIGVKPVESDLQPLLSDVVLDNQKPVEWP